MPLTFTAFREEVKAELFNILDYWIRYSVDQQNGGFYAEVTAENVPDPDAPRSVVVTSRILWTFSAVQQLFPNPKYRELADRAYEYLKKHFVDEQFGGVYWSVTAKGVPLETKKQLYGNAFAIYGLSEYYKISKNETALSTTRTIFASVIKYGYDVKQGGYIEAFERDWSNTNEYILSRGDRRKSMNTHLHILEAFANLYSVWKDPQSKFHLQHSIAMMLNHIIDPKTSRMNLFFREDWSVLTSTISYGHDIEASWLILEAAGILGDESTLTTCKKMSLTMAGAASDGLAADGALNYELEPSTGQLNDSKQWWPQAEAMVGFVNAYQLSGKVHFLEKAEKVWEFVKRYMIDQKEGEWWPAIDANHKVMPGNKISFWKGPYHNSRSCMELWKRLKK